MSLSERMAKARAKQLGQPPADVLADPNRERRGEPIWRQRAREGKLDPKVAHFVPDAERPGYDA